MGPFKRVLIIRRVMYAREFGFVFPKILPGQFLVPVVENAPRKGKIRVQNVTSVDESSLSGSLSYDWQVLTELS